MSTRRRCSPRFKNGRIGGVGLDVLPIEPMAAEDPLVRAWREGDPRLADRSILTPHAAFYSPSSLMDLRTKSAQVAVDYLAARQAAQLRERVSAAEGIGAFSQTVDVTDR